MILNVYGKDGIEKTYNADSYRLLWGTIEDLSHAVKLDELETGDNAEFVRMAMSLIMNSMETVSDLLKDVFDGLTDDDLRKCSITEIANVIVDIVKYTISEMKNLPKPKN